MTKTRFLAFLLASVSVVSVAQVGKENRTPSKRIAAASKPGSAAYQRFSISMINGEKFDVGYFAPAVADVVKAIEPLVVIEKSEFETSSEFEGRKAAEVSRKFLGGYSIEDIFAFSLPVSTESKADKSGIWSTYDADASEVNLFIQAKSSKTNGVGAPSRAFGIRPTVDLDQFDIDLVVDSKSSYKASNAYGATVNVEETRVSKFGLLSERFHPFAYERKESYFSPNPVIGFSMARENAIKELPNLRILVCFKLKMPWLFYDFFYAKPTISSPVEIYVNSRYIYGEILGFVVYSGVSGRILSRIPSGFGLPLSEK